MTLVFAERVSIHPSIGERRNIFFLAYVSQKVFQCYMFKRFKYVCEYLKRI